MSWDVLSDGREWTRVQAVFQSLDVYFSAAYAQCFSEVSDGSVEAYLYRAQGETFFFPYRLRPIAGAKELYDIVSEYGYGGPLSTTDDECFLREAYDGLSEMAADRRIVSEFCRYHPVLGNVQLAQKFRHVELCGPTVIYRCDLDDDDGLSRVKPNVRRDYRRGIREGLTVRRSRDIADVDAFYDMYVQSMVDVGASNFYLFSESFFRRTLALVDAFLLLGELRGSLVAGALFLRSAGTMHYHFGGAVRDPSLRHVNGTTVILCEALRIAKELSLQRVHLGGGVGGREDGLFKFKSRFSPDRVEYYISKHVFLEREYEDLCARHGVSPETKGMFPPYRSST